MLAYRLSRRQQLLMFSAFPSSVFTHAACRLGSNRLNRAMATSARYHDHAVLHGLSIDTFATQRSTALQELLAFCSVGKLKSTVYTGSAGLALGLWRAGTLHERVDWCTRACELAQTALSSTASRPGYYINESLLDGMAGVVLVNCLVAATQPSPQLQQLLSTYTSICCDAAGPSCEADEFLYGRAGTLFGALLLRQELGPTAIPDDVIGALVHSILASGRTLAARLPIFRESGCPLAYLWPPGAHAEPYLGAAHGLMGILYVLLHCQQWLQQDKQAIDDIIGCLRFVLSCETDAAGSAAGSGGHYPTLMKLQGVDSSDGHVLVHWCHGAPGAVYLFAKAHEVFKDDAYLQAAVRAGHLVWERGLLKKGPGLCHGVSGNAYALLRVWKVTKDPVWLERAELFAAFLVGPIGKTDWKSPDHPTSLFEGAAGGICLIAELMALEAAAGKGGIVEAPAGKQGPAADARNTALLRASDLVAFPLYELAS